MITVKELRKKYDVSDSFLRPLLDRPAFNKFRLSNDDIRPVYFNDCSELYKELDKVIKLKLQAKQAHSKFKNIAQLAS